MKCPKCGQPLKEERGNEYVECFICKTKVELPKTEQSIPPAQPIQQQIVQKPTQGFCLQCRGTNLTFNDDGSGKCNNCGRVFSWKQQQQYWQQIYQPRCFRCNNPYLQYFPNWSAVCPYCQQKYRWSYDYYGRVILREYNILDDLH